MHRAALLLVATFAMVAAPAQGVWVVDAQNRPGTSFTSLIAAVASPLVQPGDVLDVRPGNYQSPGVISRPLRILGHGASIMGVLRIDGIARPDRFTLSGFTVYTLLQITNCTGTVVIDRLGTPLGVSTTMAITNCQAVFVQRCSLVSFVNVTSSSVHFLSMPFSNFTMGPMLLLTNAQVMCTDCSLGMLNPSGVVPIQMSAGSLRWRGPHPVLASGGNAPAIISGSGVASVDPSLTWTPGVPLATSGVTLLATAEPVLTAQDVMSGGAVTGYQCDVTSAPNTVAIVVAGPRGHEVQVPFGSVWIDTTQPTAILGIGATDPQGRFSAGLVLPPNASAFLGFELTFQAITAPGHLTDAVHRTVGG